MLCVIGPDWNSYCVCSLPYCHVTQIWCQMGMSLACTRLRYSWAVHTGVEDAMWDQQAATDADLLFVSMASELMPSAALWKYCRLWDIYTMHTVAGTSLLFDGLHLTVCIPLHIILSPYSHILCAQTFQLSKIMFAKVMGIQFDSRQHKCWLLEVLNWTTFLSTGRYQVRWHFTWW